MIDLDTPINAVFADRPALDRLIRAVQLDTGSSFVDTLDKLHEAATWSLNQGDGSLRSALAWAGDVGYLEPTLKVLERRDRVVQTAYERALGQQPDLKRDPFGRVLADQGGSEDTDIGVALHDAGERERRFARVRKLDARFAGHGGRKDFEEQDVAFLQAGVDLVRTMEERHGGREHVAQQQAGQVARQLDAAIVGAADKHQRIMALDKELAKLPDAARAREVASEQARSEVAQATSGVVKMLDALESGDDDRVRLLDQVDVPITHEAVVAHLRATGRPESDYGKVLSSYVETGQLPAVPAVPEPPAVPDGFHPGSVELDKLVRARMRELGRPESEYSNVLLEIVNEHGPMLGPPIPLSGE